MIFDLIRHKMIADINMIFCRHCINESYSIEKCIELR